MTTNIEIAGPIGDNPTSTPSRPGKIGRLPSAVRHQLHLRLREGQSGQEAVRWLNGLPEVQAVMAAHFQGRPVLEMNLSRWRKTGYRQWLEEQQAAGAVAALFEQSTCLQAAAQGSLSERMALVLSARMALEIHRMKSVPDGDEKSRVWDDLTRNVLRLRRGDLEADRHRLRQAKLDPTGRPEPIKPNPTFSDPITGDNG